MWNLLPVAAWLVAIVLLAALVWDFFFVNRSYGEDVLLSSREGVDELFAAPTEAKGS